MSVMIGSRALERFWSHWSIVLVLSVLFLGPLLAPLFQATGFPLLVDSGALAHDVLSRYVCPTPAKAAHILGYPMAVCVRCWGATIGLWLGWFLLSGRGFRSERSRLLFADSCRASWSLYLGLMGAAFLLWVLEIWLWPTAPFSILLVNGVQAGFCAIFFLDALWLGWSKRQA